MNIENISFDRPDYERITENDYCAVDMHVHSCFSDSFASIKRLLKRAEQLGIGLSVTDHNEIRGSIEIVKKSEEVMIIPGIEVTSLEGVHFLAYFYDVKDLTDFFDKRIKQNRSENPFMFTKVKAEKIVDYFEEYSCISAAAHPCVPSIIGLHRAVNRRVVHESILNRINAIEVICGSMTKKMNINAGKLADDMGKPITGGSDAHSLYSLGSVVTYSKANYVSEFLDGIRKNRNIVVGRTIPFFPRISGVGQGVAKHFGYFGPSVKLRYYSIQRRLAGKS